MITKRQASHLRKLIEQYAEDSAHLLWEQDQGCGSAVVRAENDAKESKEKLECYLSRLMEKE